MNYLLDTNVCIDFLVGRSEALSRRLSENRLAVAVSAVTAAELRVGTVRSEDPVGDARRVHDFLSVIDVIAFDREAAAAYGRLLQTVPIRRSSFDRLIAAHALALERSLVTRNGRDFADVPGLKVEDWTR